MSKNDGIRYALAAASLFPWWLGLLAGCETEPRVDLSRYHDLSGVPVSVELRGSLDASHAALTPSHAGGSWARDLDRYHDLRIRIQQPENRQAAGEELYELWEREPTNFLWLELAVNYNRYLQRNGDLERLYAHDALADTNRALGRYALARRNFRSSSHGIHYRQAEYQRAELDSFQQIWLDLKLAVVDHKQGRSLDAVARLQSDLPAASALGGCRLESILWRGIAWYLMAEERLDDALHAAVLATAKADCAGYGYSVLQGRILIGSVLERRREFGAALSLWEQSTRMAKDAGYPWLVSSSLSKAASLCSKLGNYEQTLVLDRENLLHSLAMGDSLNAPRNMMNVADDLRILGRLDSCLVYQQRAQVWVAAYDDPRNKARLPYFLAEYYCHAGDFATADSLLTIALGANAAVGTAADEAQINLGLMRKGLETGQPDLAYRAMLRLEELRPALADRLPNQNFLAEYELLATLLLARQGEFRGAAAALERAREAVTARGGASWEWEFHRTAGELAQLRDDLETARREFEQCFSLARDTDNMERIVGSQFNLGHVLLEMESFSEARELFQDLDPDSSYGGRFRTRLSSLLCQGIAYGREGHTAMAVEYFEKALSLCTPYSPADLRARLHLELGRVEAARGRVEVAEGALQDALDLVREGAWRVESDELRPFNQELYRDVTEALVGLRLDHPTLVAHRDAALVTLALAEEGRWHSSSRLGVDAISLPELRQRIEDLSPILVLFVGKDRSFAWVGADGALTAHEIPGRSELARLLVPVCTDLARPGRPVDDVALDRLGETLLSALEGCWSDGELLRIVPDGILFATPWSALPYRPTKDAERTLPAIEHGPVCEAPSVKSCGRSRPVEARQHLSLLALARDSGAQGPGGAAPTLRHAELEAKQVAEIWANEQTEIRLGNEADWRALVARDGTAYDVIHVASHALVSAGAPRQSALHLAAADEPLTLPEVGRLGIDAELIYLSCCEGAASPGTALGLANFARAFLDAGARSVIASTQKVDDEAARHLATSYYRHWLTGKSKAAALRAAQLELREAGSPWSHPFYWSSYRLVGDGS